MKTRVVVVPVLIVLAGVSTFILAPLDIRLRAAILASDLFAAAVIGLLLWKQSRG